MESELGSVDFVRKSGTNMNVCLQVNLKLACSLHIRYLGQPFWGVGPWSLC